MNKKYLKMFLSLLMVVVTVIYIYYVVVLVDDELYNFGFSYNIINGLIPYRDFNMIIPPLFAYFLAFVFKIFGAKLLVYHIVLSCMIVSICVISYKSIGYRVFILYLLLLIYPYAGYNVFAMLLLFLLFYFGDKKFKHVDIIEPILISMMFLTKQTLGLLVIPSLIYSKNKKKTLLIYVISILCFLIYLLINGTVFEFFDYCLFGMFDFTSSNSTSFGALTVVEIIIIIGLIYFSFVTKRKDLFFCLCFQVMAFPIVNYMHFLVSFVPVIYLILKGLKSNKYVTYFTFVSVLSCFVSFNFVYFTKGHDYKSVENYKVNNFMEGRITYMYVDNFLVDVKSFVRKYEDYRLFTFGTFSYLIKLNLDLPINKYDIINDGNMGYNGANRYLDEIDSYCDENKCIFIINDFEEEVSKNVQTNKKILNYVKSDYNKVYSSNTFSVYIN